MRRKIIKHGLRNHYLYGTYRGIISRCYNKNDKAYERYGKKGVSVSPNWFNGIDHSLIGNFIRDVEPLYEQAKLKYPMEKLSIDRIDNDGNYEIGNVRVTTYKVQANNKSNNIKLDELIGKRYGRLVIKSIVGHDDISRLIVSVKCDCSVVKNVWYQLLKSRSCRSCGCYSKEFVRECYENKRNIKLGDMFSFWKIIDLNYIVNKCGDLQYKVRCVICDSTEKYTSLHNLKRSRSKMCRKCSAKKYYEKKRNIHVGDRYNYWEIIDLDYILDKHRQIHYNCLCTKCNFTKKYVSLNSLKMAKSIMCQSCSTKKSHIKRKQLKELLEQGINYA